MTIERRVLGIGLVIGLAVRLYFAFLDTPHIAWDASTYILASHSFLNGKVFADCCSVGGLYPYLLSIIFRFSGIDNFTAIRIVQIILDICTGFMIYATARNFFGLKTAGITFILYMFNPFTSAYTGMVLTETVAVFFATAFLLIVTRQEFSRHWAYWTLAGISLGCIVWNKVSYLPYACVMIIGLSAFVVQSRKKILAAGIICLACLIVNAYTLYANRVTYSVWQIVPPYRSTHMLLYSMFFMGRYPELEVLRKPPKEYVEVVQSYWREVAYDYSKVAMLDRQYRTLFIRKLLEYPYTYMYIIAQNILWLWDKPYLFMYYDPTYPDMSLVWSILNCALIIIHILGLTGCIVSRRHSHQRALILCTISFFLFILSFAFVTNETRISIPYYPYIFLWAGYGIVVLKRLFVK